MSRKQIILITGANGEIGHGLIQHLHQSDDAPPVVTLDIRPPSDAVAPYVETAITGDILDTALLDEISTAYEISAVYHLAALLSTHAEKRPEMAHRVNVDGTVNLLAMSAAQAERDGRAVKFIFPSSIAVYGIDAPAVKRSAPPVAEDQFLNPITMYGCNKLYCEHLGRYYARNYRQADAVTGAGVDFRALRFPGIISAQTVPSGGTSDYAPEMLHAAARGEPYAAFVRPDTVIPFMVLPDAVKALLDLAAAPRHHLTRTAYNVTAFSLSAADVAGRVRESFPSSGGVTYAPVVGRQRIVDSWPADIDDRAARHDWDWSPDYDADRAFADYLLPGIRAQYDLQQRG